MKTGKSASKLILVITALAVVLAGLVYLGKMVPDAGAYTNPHGGYTPGTGMCAKCHSGHTSFGLDLLRAFTQRQTCYTCHDGSNSIYDVKDQFGETVIGASVYSSYHPVPTGIQLCTNCHDPHLNPVSTPRILAVGADKVSSGNPVCGVCHGAVSPVNGKDMLTDFVSTAHDTEMSAPSSGTDIKCIGCHAPHGSPNKPLLRQEITGPEAATSAVTGNNNTLCFACHTSSAASYAGSAIYEAVYHGTKTSSTVALTVYNGTGYQATLCLNCHEPHGKTGVSKYRRADSNALCQTCHDDASVSHPATYSYQGTAAYSAGAHNTAAPIPMVYTYLLSDSESLAWEKSGNSSEFPTPSSPGVAATSAQKNAAYATDGSFWATGSAVAEGDYNYQMFKFRLNEEVDDLRTLTAKWRGYGEPTAGHLTELLIWNKTSLSWEALDSGLLGDPDNPGLLTGSVSSGLSDYVDDNNDVYLLAKAKHDATGPVISGISVTNGGTSAIFNWTTNESANSYVYFGLSSGTTLDDYSNWYSDSSYVTSHALLVTGLTTSTDYFYRIRTIDKLGNETISSEQTLHTSTAPTVPTGLSGPTSDPAYGSFVWVNFSWSASTDIDPDDTVSYQLQVFKDGALYSSVNTAATNSNIYLDWYNGPYTVTWKVRAVDNHGIVSAWATGTSFPHTGVIDTCQASVDRKDGTLLAAVLNRINSWGRQKVTEVTDGVHSVLAAASLILFDRDDTLAYSPQQPRHFSVNTDYIELEVNAINPDVQSGYCGTCHAPHGKDDGTGSPIPKQLDYAIPSVCFGGGFGCHGDAGNSARGINISDRISSSNSLARHGKSSTGQAANGTLDCVNCHNPHTNTADSKVIDPFNKGNSYSLTNQMANYIGSGGEVYVMAKSRHDGQPPAINSGPTVSNLQANQVTVTWTTNETTVGYVYYGPVGSGYTDKATSINGQSTTHTAYLTGLVVGTNYKFSVWAQDSVGNYTTTADQVVDTVAPTITGSGPSVSYSGNQATFSWTTNEASNSYVDYTPEEIYSVGNYVYHAGNSSLVTSHSVAVNGLVAGQVYHYQVYSEDARGNRVTSGDNVFKLSNSPPAPTGIGPTGDLLDGTTPLNIDIQWNASVDPDGDSVQYYAQLSTASNFSTSTNSGWTGGTTWATQIDNWDDLTYYWRVKAKDEWGAESVWSATYSFMHRGPPASCPNLYVWDGKKYQFVTDIAGSDVGLKDTSTGKYVEINPGLPVAIPWNMLQEKNGQYSIKLKSERDEVDFIDQAILTAVDHPVGTRIAFNALVRGKLPVKMYTYNADLRPLKKATYFNNAIYTGAKGLKPVDITELVAKADNREAEGVYGDDNQFTLDLGDLDGAKHIKLVMHGWTEFNGKSERKVAMEKYATGLKRAKTFYEILQPDGTWKAYDIKHFNGLPKTEVLDLTGKFPEGTKDYVVRLRGMHRPHIDYVGVDTSAPAKFTEQDLQIINADLGYRGISNPTKDGKGFEYDSLSRLIMTHEGNFTKYGDVWPLLQEVDDKLVVMDSGDEISLNFRALPPPAPGMTRSFFLKNWVYYKEFDLARVEPVPFRGMDMNKLPESFGKYPDELKASLAAWNTRVHQAEMRYEKGFWGKLHDKFLAFIDKVAKSFALLWDSLSTLFAGDAGTKDNPLVREYQPAVPKWWEERPWEDHYSLNTNFVSLQVDDTVYSSVNNSVYTINSAGSAIWEKSGSVDQFPTPSSPGTDASAHAAEISGRDGSSWRTDNYPSPNTSDGSYNYQMFKFVINNPISKLFSFKVFWEGYGEPSTGYNTTVSLWNFNTSSWDAIKSQVMGNNTVVTTEKAVNFNPYCYKCHGGSVPTGVSLGSITRNISTSFASDIHGGGTGPQWIAADSGGEFGTNFYTTGGSIAPSYSRGDAAGLQCADCHDIHGSENVYHLRETLNASDGVKSNPANAVNSVPGVDYANNANVQNFCASCHVGTSDDYHRACLDCHRQGTDHHSAPTAGDFSRACISCHTHGGSMPRHGRCHCWLDADAKAF